MIFFVHMLFSVLMASQQTDLSILSAPYLGQVPPRDIPVLSAKEMLPDPIRIEGDRTEPRVVPFSPAIWDSDDPSMVQEDERTHFDSDHASTAPIFKKSTQIWPRNANTRIVAFADLDGDGDLDGVNASMNTPSRIILNDGKGHFSDSGQRFQGPKHGVDIGDLDLDGDMDIFFGPIGMPDTALYFNAGNGIFKESPVIFNVNENVHLVDIENDGDLDAYLANDGLLLNDGKGKFGKIGLLDFHPWAFSDLNGDGYVDAVSEQNMPDSRSKAIVVYLNDRNGNFKKHSVFPAGESGVRLKQSGLADLDGDRDKDLVFLYDRRYASAGILFNDGSGRFTDSAQQLASIAEPSWVSFGTGDLNGDGAVDIVITDKENPAQVWLNDGGGKFYDSGVRLGRGEGNTWCNCVLADFDNDGDIDVFIANRLSGEHGLWFNQWIKN